MSKINKIVRNPVTRKSYSYEMGGVRLNFELRQDNTQEMLHFKELMKAGIADIDKDLREFRKK